jgi:hypothetical protein
MDSIIHIVIQQLRKDPEYFPVTTSLLTARATAQTNHIRSAIKQSEKHVEATLKAATEQCGGTAVKMALTGARGFPDRLLLLPGRVVFVEVKGTGGKPDPMQEVWKRKIEALGLDWYLLDHTDGIDAILRGPEALGVEPEYAPAATSLILDQPTMENCPRCGAA